MTKNLVSGLILTSLAQIWVPKFFFDGFYLYCILDIVASYHWMQFQGYLKNQTWKKGKKLSFGTNFGPFGLTDVIS